MAESKASTNEVDSTCDVAVNAVNHLKQGKRHLLVQDYVSAVSSLEGACQLFAQKYGEAADECGEPYLYYGKALLELARMETGVLGNALEGVPAEDDESDSEDDQVESPDNITEEEREKIKQDVDAAIDENSRDLEEKFQQLKEKSDNETATPNANEDKSGSDKLDDLVKEEKLEVGEKSENEVATSTADETTKLDVSDKLEDPKKVDGTSANGKSNSEVEGDTVSKKDETENQATTNDSGELKGDIEKASVGIADAEMEEDTVSKKDETENKATTDNLEIKRDIEKASVGIPDAEMEEDTVSKKDETENKATTDKEEVKGEIEKASVCIADAEMEEDTVTKKDEMKNKATTDNSEELKEDIKKASVIIADEEKMEVTADKERKDGDESVGLTDDDAGRKIQHEKIGSTSDKNVVAAKDAEEAVETSADSKHDLEGLGDKEGSSTDKVLSGAEIEEISKSKLEDLVDADGKMETTNANEKVELGTDMEVKAEVLMDTELAVKKSEVPQKVEESPKESVQEASVIDATNEVEKMETEVSEKSSSVSEENTLGLSGKNVDATEQQENKIDDAPGTSNGATEPNDDQDESMEDDGDALDENDTSNVDETKDESEAGPSGSNQDKEEEVSNLQLGWEVLEIAKNIFKRLSETDKKMELKTAEVLLKLGEISIESENYKQAIEDLGECLRLQKCHLAPDDRAIAETFYQLGLANSFYGQFEEAIESFRRSMQVIEERIATLQQVSAVSSDKNVDSGLKDSVEAAKRDGAEDPIEAAKREIEDLQGVLPDIKSKIEDTEDLMKNSEVALKEAAMQRLQEDASAASITETVPKEQDISKPTNNIMHLLKRKRKSEGNVDTNADVDAKKHRSASGDRCTNGTSVENGASSPMQDVGLQNVGSTA